MNPLGIFWRGMAMGAADVVPGVSGGTIALITGIYDRLIAALSAVNKTSVRLLLQGQWRQLWQHFDAGFLAVLFLGIVTAIITLANVIHFLLETHPLPLWSFFFGLVLASVIHLLQKELWPVTPVSLVLGGLGVIVALAIAFAPVAGFPPTYWGFTFAGALAICAMILPGISGSFILLIIGMYAPVIEALTTPAMGYLACFIVGCTVGLLSFSKLLHFLVGHYRAPTMALLTGFLAGSLVSLWPWQIPTVVVMDRHGEDRVVQSDPVLPSTFADQVSDPTILLCLVAMVFGIAVIASATVADKYSSAARP
ncbi:inner membrane protein [Luminiphilus syltensis NOR5-1B]|uniref:Inner membrane protein n=1 Tax=Luminiphilus syltensis NOR5-1B TaxID=565045 RepID=B8KSK3_9GAMM|nr:DUF368 domain-containing protein [Luminiphilus syltensis]EED34770.1 inner membrane protein [Luminiphilus syltensis NOR5-1B]